MERKNYFVGVLLTASRNFNNRIQFVGIKKKDGKVGLYSRTKAFGVKPDLSRMKWHGVFDSNSECIEAIRSGLNEMTLRGITNPTVSFAHAK